MATDNKQTIITYRPLFQVLRRLTAQIRQRKSVRELCCRYERAAQQQEPAAARSQSDHVNTVHNIAA